jgi:hypothetical protein
MLIAHAENVLVQMLFRAYTHPEHCLIEDPSKYGVG